MGDGGKGSVKRRRREKEKGGEVWVGRREEERRKEAGAGRLHPMPSFDFHMSMTEDC